MDMTQFRTKVAFAGLFAALALIFSYIEILIPFNPSIPGIKLGIANLVILIVLYYMDGKYAFVINLVRVVVAGLLFTGVFGMFYSLAGAVLSLCVMILLKKTNLFSIIGVSMAGGVAHNFGQLVIAAVLIGSEKVMAYFPVLIFSGLISGIIIGFLAHILLKRLPGTPYNG